MCPGMDNLPATTPSFGDRDTPLSEAPSGALAVALGYALARPQSADTFAPFCAVVEELMARPSGRSQPGPLGRYDERFEFGVIMNALPDRMARAVAMLYQAQRGMRWARTGNRHGTNPSKSGNS